MAQAPYSPVPTAEPTLRPAQQVDVNAPAGAFGVGTAEALKGVGADVTHAGDQLFDTALQINKLRVENDVMDRTTNYEKAANEAHANFTQLKGQQAADALPDYYKNLEKLRQDNRGDLPLFAQVQYDSNTKNMQGRLYFNAAGHAGEQLASSSVSNSKASLDLSKQSASQFVSDDAAYNAQLKTIDDRALDFYKKVNGPSSTMSDDQIRGMDSYKDFVLNQRSDVNLERARLMALTDPQRAQKFLAGAQATGQVRGDKLPQVEQFITQRMYNVAAPAIARGVTDGSQYDWGSKTVNLPRAREAIGGEETGNKYDFNPGVDTAHGHALGRYQVMSGFLPDYLKAAGLPDMSEKQFLSSPAAQDTVFEKVFGGNMTKFGSFNEAASRWFTGKSVADARADGKVDALGTGIDGYLKNTNGYLAKSSSLEQQADAVRTVAGQQSPDPELAEHAVQHLRTLNYEQNFIKRGALQDAQQYVAGLLTKGGISTVDDLYKNPDGAGVLANAPKTFLAELPAMINRYNTAASKVPNEIIMNRVTGLFHSEDPVDRQKAASLDPTTLGLDRGSVDKIWALQKDLYKQGHSDPKVSSAYHEILEHYPESTPKVGDDKERYLQFLGSLSNYIQGFQQQNNRAPTFEDYDKMGEILTKKTTNNWFTADKQEFETPVPEEVTNNFKPQGWSDEQIRDYYTQAIARERFNQLYKGSSGSDKSKQ